MKNNVETVPKINVFHSAAGEEFPPLYPYSVILSEAKNLLFPQSLKQEILRTKILRMTQKGKFSRILEQF